MKRYAPSVSICIYRWRSLIRFHERFCLNNQINSFCFLLGGRRGLGNNAVIAVQLNWYRWKSVDKKRHHICRAVKRGASKKDESDVFVSSVTVAGWMPEKHSCAVLKVDLIGDWLQAVEGVHTDKKIFKKQIGTPTASERVLFDCKGKRYYSGMYPSAVFVEKLQNLQSSK